MRVLLFRLRRWWGRAWCERQGHVEQRIEEPERRGGRIWVLIRCARCRSVLAVEPLA